MPRRESTVMTLSNLERYERIAWAYDLLDLPFEYARATSWTPRRSSTNVWGYPRITTPIIPYEVERADRIKSGWLPPFSRVVGACA
jgi:hypothetical protein